MFIQLGSSNFIRVSENRFVEAGEAARRGLSRYVPGAASTPKRAVAKSTPPALKGGALIKPPSAAQTRSQPRDIPDAMVRGLSNQVINELIAKGVLQRPKSLVHAGAHLWPVGAWQVAEQRGLVW